MHRMVNCWYVCCVLAKIIFFFSAKCQIFRIPISNILKWKWKWISICRVCMYCGWALQAQKKKKKNKTFLFRLIAISIWNAKRKANTRLKLQEKILAYNLRHKSIWAHLFYCTKFASIQHSTATTCHPKCSKRSQRATDYRPEKYTKMRERKQKDQSILIS